MKPAEPRTYRATTEAWLGQLLLPVCFFVLIIITAINSNWLSLGMGALALLLLTLLVVFDYLLPMSRNWVFLDSTCIEGCLNGRYFHLYWGEIEAAWRYSQPHKQFICLGTSGGTVIIPLRFLDESALWEHVRVSVPQAALKDNAHRLLPDYHDWEAARTTFLSNPVERQVSDHWLQQVVGWMGVVFFGFGVIDALRDYHWLDDFGILVVNALLLIPSLAMVLNWGITQVGPAEIKRYTIFGCWSINWNEICRIELDLFETVVVLIGYQRQLVIPGPVLWCGPVRRETLAYFIAMAENRCIPLRHSLSAIFRASRNTKVKKKSEDQS